MNYFIIKYIWAFIFFLSYSLKTILKLKIRPIILNNKITKLVSSKSLKQSKVINMYFIFQYSYIRHVQVITECSDKYQDVWIDYFRLLDQFTEKSIQFYLLKIVS